MNLRSAFFVTRGSGSATTFPHTVTIVSFIAASSCAPAPRWWQVFDVMQWLVAAVAVAGLLWYLVLAVAGWLQFALPEVSRWGIVPYPFVMLGGGLLAGLLLTAAARVFSRAGARRRRALVEGRLRTAIAARPSDVEARFQSAAEMAVAVRGVIAGADGAARRSPARCATPAARGGCCRRSTRSA